MAANPGPPRDAMHQPPELTVLLFAAARDHAGRDSVTVSAPSVGELRRRLSEQYPRLASLLARSAVAVNHDFADDSRPLAPGDEVAIIPPVSGG